MPQHPLTLPLPLPLPSPHSTQLTFTLAFWATCQDWKMCSSALAVAVVNAQLVYESCVVWLLLCVCGGWEEVDADTTGVKVREAARACVRACVRTCAGARVCVCGSCPNPPPLPRCAM